MSLYLEKQESELSKKFLKNGYVILKQKDLTHLKYIKNLIVKKSAKILNIDEPNDKDSEKFLNNIHKNIKIKDLNKFRLQIIKYISEDKNFKKNYFYSARNLLFTLVGNELAMQSRVNLSIQLPKDESSLLPVHSDIWSGDSPFEVVVWIPMVNCYSTKTMYLLKPEKYKKIHKNFSKYIGKSSLEFYKLIKNEVEWIKINFGEVLIFNQALPHGNIINKENETRWSMNCRFKSLYSPYGDKKIGEFFEPITLRAASKIGMQYHLPKIND
ncbi:MAG: 2OG-Fe(II) oxygenase [Pelagibacterales bacterium]|nr:2OG-Fe(II) oxygenase [Pelagibacterales bacterium]